MGWRDRGYLPHFDRPGLVQSVNFRLSDAVPDAVIQGWLDELRYETEEARLRELRKRITRYEDVGYGCCVLRETVAAQLVEGALRHFEGVRYRLHAWVVMPNHLHVLFEPTIVWTLGKIIGSWKTYTSRRIHEGFPESCHPLWQREYFDRFIRDDEHFWNEVAYIENNPVKAGLASDAASFRWSSAFNRSES
ncbi:transposase [bacterium]|nr:MAG: transposase [bacterium]